MIVAVDNKVSNNLCMIMIVGVDNNASNNL